jgi:hypothetical protein
VKKLVIGCLVAVVVMGVAGAVGTYFVYRKVKSTLAQFTEFAKAPEIEQQVRNTAPFSPPANREMTPRQIERFVRVQGTVRAQLGTRFADMQARYRTLFEKREASAIDLPQIIGAYRDLASAWTEAKRTQVGALNAQGFSLDEYRWVRNQAYAALGLAIVDIDVGRLVEAITQGRTDYRPGLGGSVGPSGPKANQAVIEPYKKALEENVALTFFGL